MNNKDNTLEEAFARVTLADVWSEAPLAEGPLLRDGKYRSPFREDKTASFSVSRGMKAFRDFAREDIKGGVWKFVQLCHPDWSKADVARHIIRKAGLDPEAGRKPFNAAAWKREKQAVAEAVAVKRERAVKLVGSIPENKLGEAPEKVRMRYKEMVADGHRDTGWQARLAEERGWPLEWVEHLLIQGKLGRGSDASPCFAVEARTKRGDDRLLGYHRRFIDRESGKKGWYYVPNMKHYQREIAAAPFYLGNPDAADVWILTEGQWDAATIYGMLGGFSEHVLRESCVWGIRGAQGMEVWTSLYAARARTRRERLILCLVPDTDKAASRWLEARQERAGKPPLPSWAERLRSVTECRVVWLRLSGGAPLGIKDVNDWWQAVGEVGTARFVDALDRALAGKGEGLRG